jgi:mannose-6-phosphate isomerase
MAAQLWSKTPNNAQIDDSKHYSEVTTLRQLFSGWNDPFADLHIDVDGHIPFESILSPVNRRTSGRVPEEEPAACRKIRSRSMGTRDSVPTKGIMNDLSHILRLTDQILSFSKALPLQIHPDLSLAAKLHKEDPNKFGDTMHKPEIAIALSKFELFAGWKPLKDIQTLFELNHLGKFVPNPGQFNDETLRQTCKALLSAPPQTVAETTKDLQAIPESQLGAHSYIPSLLGRLVKQYGEGDNGNLVAALLMNYLTLGPGDAVFVPADSIHAYLEGDIVECMARSDNVINTGFCPAAERDSVELFGQALTFAPHSAQEAFLPRKKSDKGMNGKTDVYAPPISEFNVLYTTLGAGEKETHKSILGPSLMIVTKGCGYMNIPGDKSVELKEGWVFFVGQGVALEFATDKGMAVYRAYAE